MQKTILGPGTGHIESDSIDEVPSAHAVATHHSDHVQLYLSGIAWTSGTLETQTRTIFDLFERGVNEFGGDVRSVVRNRLRIGESHLTPDNRRPVNEIRAEFFEEPHYPASTVVEVSGLAHEDALVEIEADAVIPDTDWEVQVRTDD